MDVGVARPRAQGQAMIRTATAAARLRLNSEFSGARVQAAKVAKGDDHYDRHEITGYHIYEALDRGSGALGVADHEGNLAKQRLLADPGGLHLESAYGVERSARHTVTGALVDGNALAGHHRLVDGG